MVCTEGVVVAERLKELEVAWLPGSEEDEVPFAEVAPPGGVVTMVVEVVKVTVNAVVLEVSLVDVGTTGGVVKLVVEVVKAAAGDEVEGAGAELNESVGDIREVVLLIVNGKAEVGALKPVGVAVTATREEHAEAARAPTATCEQVGSTGESLNCANSELPSQLKKMAGPTSEAFHCRKPLTNENVVLTSFGGGCSKEAKAADVEPYSLATVSPSCRRYPLLRINGVAASQSSWPTTAKVDSVDGPDAVWDTL